VPAKGEIKSLVQESASKLKNAPVQEYVPNLVYHEVKDEVLARAAERSSALV
jgi:hypothetical protein